MFARRLYDWPGAGWQNAFSQMEQMKRDVTRLSNALFGSSSPRLSSSGVFPAVNISEDKDKYYVRAELPGIKNEDIDIQITGRNLSISGERKIDTQGDNVKYHRKERDAGKFSRIIGLPSDIDAEKVAAKIVNGMLAVTIPKSEAAKPRQIAVN